MTNLETYFKKSQPLEEYIDRMKDNRNNLLCMQNITSLWKVKILEWITYQ